MDYYSTGVTVDGGRICPYAFGESVAHNVPDQVGPQNEAILTAAHDGSSRRGWRLLFI